MNIYTIRNTEIGYSNRPFYFESDSEALQYVLNVLTADSDRSLINLRDCLLLECIGSIDFEAGNIISTERRIVSDLESIWARVPTECMPRTSKELVNMINKNVGRVNSLEEQLNKICSSLSTHFKFIRKVLK